MSFFSGELHQKQLQHLSKKHRLTLSGTGSSSAKGFFLADLFGKTDFETVFWVIEGTDEAQRTVDTFQFWRDQHLTSDKTQDIRVLNYCIESGQGIGDFEKILRLYEVQREEKKLVVCDPSFFFLSFPSRQVMSKLSPVIKVGDVFDDTEMINQLLGVGYVFSSNDFLDPGRYCKRGGILNIFSPHMSHPVKIELDGVEVLGIYEFDQATGEIIKKHKMVSLMPLRFEQEKGVLSDHLSPKHLIVSDEIDLSPEYSEKMQSLVLQSTAPSVITFTAFPEEDDSHYAYLYYLSLMKFQDVFDFLNDVREKTASGWKVAVFTRHYEELKALLTEEGIRFSCTENYLPQTGFHIVDSTDIAYTPTSFQNADLKISVITDREIFDFRQIRRKTTKVQRKIYLEFIQKLKAGDYVVHTDHGVGRFAGIEPQEIDGLHREYLKIEYAENDRLYVPIDQAEKVNKYVGVGNTEPKLTRLGSGEWDLVTKRVKEEAEKVAKELLALYAKRDMAVGHSFLKDDDTTEKFAESFKYEPTPGQLRAFIDVTKDMESPKPMDRLICGDVGFGKTEVAMRAVFKAFRSGKQAAVISPITILADQHYQSFFKRMNLFGVRVEMLSRFRTSAEQKVILRQLADGKIDVIIGTHRLLQPDVKFQDLGLLVVDEEQRFGVKQKERIKEMRAEVDIITMTATPIPRTLNMSMNNLRDITVITTPPPGRLPIITEVRRFSETLIQEAVDREIKRKGQVYFLHNRVQTIESMADKLRTMFPQYRIVTAHGSLPAAELEKRIMAFKEREYDILVSSTIIENGIDLPNANTMVVNNTENFGLSQLYQLRGRIGRARTQAYAYFLYHAQKLKPDAKKRLRAIVEANELGAGFQIAMHDLEIRGAGDVLGVNQSGSMNMVGVNHFVRLLQQTVAELKAGKQVTQEFAEMEKITVDLPLSAYIPDSYIDETREKINAYQRLSSSVTLESLAELQHEFEEDYGELPDEVSNLFKVIEIKLYARDADIMAMRVMEQGGRREMVLTMGKRMGPQQIYRLLQFHSKWYVSGSTLKILMSDLGFVWVEGLKDALKVMNRGGAEEMSKG